MTNTVINVKCKYQRPIYGKNYDLRKWCENPNNVYIGRKGIILLPNLITGKKNVILKMIVYGRINLNLEKMEIEKK